MGLKLWWRLSVQLEWKWINTFKAYIGNGRQVEIFVCGRGYHVFKDVWDPYLGNSFTTKHERNNQYDNNVTLAITHAFFNKKCMNVPIIYM